MNWTYIEDNSRKFRYLIDDLEHANPSSAMTLQYFREGYGWRQVQSWNTRDLLWLKLQKCNA